jgi:hypothetical protein
MKNFISIFTAVCLAPLTLQSCSVTGAPELSKYQSFATAYFSTGYGPEAINAYRTAQDDYTRAARRNAIVLSAMGSIDIKYEDFVSALTRESQTVPFATTLLSLSLSGAGTLVGSSAAKTVLAAVDTGVKGAKAAYDKDILSDRTIQFLQKQMRANRNLVRTRILQSLTGDTRVYPLELALIDLNDYAAAGTIGAGLTGIDEQTSANLTRTEVLKATEIAVYGADSASDTIIDYLTSGGTAAQARLQTWLRNHKQNVTSWLFINGGQFAALRSQFVKELR